MEQTNLRMKFKKMEIEMITERGDLDGAKHLEKERQRLIDRKRQKEPKEDRERGITLCMYT